MEETYNVLFNERLKAICFTGMRINNCKEKPCAWKEIYGKNLKNMGVSQNTLSSILKAWEKSGIIKKVKAPFPYRSKYQRVKETPEFKILEYKSKMIEYRSNQQRSYMSPYADENINIMQKLQGIGKEIVQDWEWFSNLIFLWLLQRGPGSEIKTSANEIAFYCFLLVDYILNSAVNLHGECREEAKRVLQKQMRKLEIAFSEQRELEKTFSEHSEFEKYRDSSNMIDALTKALTIKS